VPVIADAASSGDVDLRPGYTSMAARSAPLGGLFRPPKPALLVIHPGRRRQSNLGAEFNAFWFLMHVPGSRFNGCSVKIW
jgi:hypothetical protein